MARDPGSVWKPLPEAGAPDGYTKTQMIYHSTGTRGSAAGNWAYFSRGDVLVESTFVVGYSAADPTLQIMDSTDRADANGRANQRGISVETVGTGDEPFTDWQVQELIRLGRWARKVHGILPRIIPSEPEGGFGWHVMFGAPGPWTSSRGKVCPGAVRIQQLKTVIFPAIFAGVFPEEDELSAADVKAITDYIERGVVTRLHHMAARLSGECVIYKLAGADNHVAANLGAWVPLPASAPAAYARLLVARGYARQIVEVPANEFGYLRQVSLAPQSGQVDTGKVVEALLAAIPPAQAEAAAERAEADLAAQAKAFADEWDRRARDGDPATGPVT
jgi:hypothetical protein